MTSIPIGDSPGLPAPPSPRRPESARPTPFPAIVGMMVDGASTPASPPNDRDAADGPYVGPIYGRVSDRAQPSTEARLRERASQRRTDGRRTDVAEPPRAPAEPGGRDVDRDDDVTDDNATAEAAAGSPAAERSSATQGDESLDRAPRASSEEDTTPASTAGQENGSDGTGIESQATASSHLEREQGGDPLAAGDIPEADPIGPIDQEATDAKRSSGAGAQLADDEASEGADQATPAGSSTTPSESTGDARRGGEFEESDFDDPPSGETTGTRSDDPARSGRGSEGDGGTVVDADAQGDTDLEGVRGIDKPQDPGRAATSQDADGPTPLAAADASRDDVSRGIDTTLEPAGGRSEGAADRPLSPPAAAQAVDSVDAGSASRGPTTGPETLTRVQQQRVIERVHRALMAAQQRGTPLRLRLSPPELGSLQLELQLQRGRLHVRFQTETETAKQVLLDQWPQLRSRLENQGLRVGTFDVSWNGPGTPGDARSDMQRGPRDGARTFRQASSDESTAGDDRADASRAARLSQHTGRLNVFV